MMRAPRGQTALEYILIVSGVLIVVLVIILAVTTVINGPQTGINETLNTLRPIR